MSENNDFSVRLRRVCDQGNWSQAALAAELGISQSTISRALNSRNKSNPPDVLVEWVLVQEVEEHLKRDEGEIVRNYRKGFKFSALGLVLGLLIGIAIGMSGTRTFIYFFTDVSSDYNPSESIVKATFAKFERYKHHMRGMDPVYFSCADIYTISKYLMVDSEKLINDYKLPIKYGLPCQHFSPVVEYDPVDNLNGPPPKIDFQSGLTREPLEQ
ncbi:helix-turn-helix domain-containing protein [Thalassospira sp. TSL5-1]|uniref:helix-turn-helix domain-containing protein n=1 Tax=Thalassospira sp. TSL5-1 TaxID=1544451 RepID=UPI00093C4466|nr:helix-turn-helix transcriptional regulator [Thalassospira sp. TSL5-1]